jgi:hypothetical protein
VAGAVAGTAIPVVGTGLGAFTGAALGAITAKQMMEVNTNNNRQPSNKYGE